MKQGFLYAAAAILSILGLAKIASAFGASPVLDTFDPVFGVKFAVLFLAVGVTEVAVGVFCCLRRYSYRSRAILVVWISSCFLLYRAGLWWQGYRRPCSCLGALTDAISISPGTADLIAKFLLTMLLIGGALTLTPRRAA